MTDFEALILGIIQGITEFLPVSSSGHLKIAEYFFGFENLDDFILFDLICHLGTLFAIFSVFAKEIKGLLTKDFTLFLQIILGTLPLFPILFVLKPIENLYNQPQLLGLFFLITALLLYLGIRFGHDSTASERYKMRWRDPIFIGIFQTLALLPGVSRSGATISAARLVGWQSRDAITFSFLLAIPAILGGATLKVMQCLMGQKMASTLQFSQYFTGFLTSFFVGCFSLLLLIKLALKDKFMYFVWYCLFLGVALSYYFMR